MGDVAIQDTDRHTNLYMYVQHIIRGVVRTKCGQADILLITVLKQFVPITRTPRVGCVQGSHIEKKSKFPDFSLTFH